MCGFAGFHSPRGLSAGVSTIVKDISDGLRHRGPDDYGEWIEPALGLGLAFRRLAIVDLTEQGHQPMISQNGRFVLAMNGEIYNHRELRTRLEKLGCRFTGHSDTEVLLNGIIEWGLEATLLLCVGMFAIALVDRFESKLWLARDRLGEKPLFYGWSNHHFFFGSSLRAFRAHPGFSAEVDRGSLTHYLRHGYVPSPYCIFKGFQKLLPGWILSLSLDGSATRQIATLKRYWSIPMPDPGQLFKGSAEDYVRGLEELLRETIKNQMLADVPVGAFLSGGIDSSTVVSLMQAAATIPVRTFCVGFSDARLDESRYAERIAAHLGTQHTTWYCQDEEVLELAEKVPEAYCEPFADDSQLPTLAVARIARQQVTVCLSGDGGDELFHGYGRYGRTVQRWQQINRHPAALAALSFTLNSLSAAARLLTESPFKRRLISKVAKGRSQWLAEHLPAYYRHRVSVLKSPDLFLDETQVTPDFFDGAAQIGGWEPTEAWLSYIDLNTYLMDHILAKVDRAAMAFGLETRIPLLDHRIVEYAARAPQNIKRREGLSKWPLRQVLARHVPAEFAQGPKRGFWTPMSRWLRGPLREWGEGQLAAERLRREGFFEERQVRRLWTEHQEGNRDRAPLLWHFLVFQAWQESFKSRALVV
jgi:asparagine synthase (glutamine-hydrolysing)